jgi:uncharacterized membrane protein YbhN (UPF0104 family)
LADRVVSFLDSFLTGVQSMKDLRFAAVMVATTALNSCLHILSLWALIRAFCFTGLGLMAALAVLVMTLLAALIPPPPLMAGVFEAFVVAGLGLYAVGKDAAAAYAVVCHVSHLAFNLGCGLLFLWLDRVSMRKIAEFGHSLAARREHPASD